MSLSDRLPLIDQARVVVDALGEALGVLEVHQARLTIALAELGDIHLPEDPEPAWQAELLEPLAPFYLAYQLEQAGVLRTAELVAGLFASGAITASLGTTAPLIRNFWLERRNRLTEPERAELFARVFEQPHCDRLLHAVMQDIASHADNLEQPDWREAVHLEQHARQLVDFLAARSGGMTAFAASDMITAINAGFGFLVDRSLHAAFGVRGWWELVGAVSGPAGPEVTEIRRCIARGRDGQTVLLWLAASVRGASFRLDLGAEHTRALLAAAQSWLDTSAFGGARAVDATQRTTAAAVS